MADDSRKEPDRLNSTSVAFKEYPSENGNSIPTIDPILERRITRKYDLHIMPWLFGLWLFAALDRANIGNANIEGLTTSLHLTGNKFNIALTIFYIPYILVVIPSNWALTYLGAGRYLPALVIAWGIVDTCMGFVTDYAGLIVARFFLGLCEGGIIGGFIIYLALFYKRNQMALRIAIFFCASPLSGAIGGLLATGLGMIDHGGYNGWPWIFFIEGALTILFGILALLFLPNDPFTSKFLTSEEQVGAISRLRLEYGIGPFSPASHDESTDKLSLHSIKLALLNPNTILLSIANFLIITPIYSFSLFLPTIINAMGYRRVTAQLFTVPPNLLAFVIVLVVAVASDRLRSRGPFMLGGLIFAIVGYVMLIVGPKVSVMYAGTFFVAVGDYAISPVLQSWLSNNLAPHYVRATGVGFQVTLANFSAFVGTFTYLPADAPRYRTGHFINLSFLVLCFFLCIIDMLYILFENRQRATGKRDERLSGEVGRTSESENAEAKLGHLHPKFRYTL